MLKILVIATYDSFVKSGIKLAKRLSNNIDVAIQKIKNNQLSIRQIKESNLDNYNYLDYRSLSDTDFNKYDVIIVAIGNAASRAFTERFLKIYSNKTQRPITISIFPGVIFGHTESILSRIHFDIVLANNENDTNIINEIAKIYNLSVTVINYGLVNIDNSIEKIKDRKQKLYNLFFIDQVKIPESREERKFLIDQLINLAQKRPDYHVYLKTRVINKELTVHKNKYSYAKLLSGYHSLPKNLSIFEGSMDEAYSLMDMCLSFSSTVSIEALYYKIPSFIIADLGINNKLYNYPFIGSDIFITFNELINNPKIQYNVRENWYKKNVFFIEERDILLKNTISNLKHLNRKLTIPETLFGGNFQVKKRSNKLIRKVRKFIISPRLFFVDSTLHQAIKRRKSL